MVKSRVNNIGELLRDSFGDDVQVLHEDTAFLTAPGEHYGSIMLALKVKIKRQSTGKEQDLNLVAKVLPASEMLRLSFDTPVTFKKEVSAYKEAIPALVKLQEEFGVPENKYYDKLFPKCHGARLSLDENKNVVDEDALLIFENLKVQGFITEDRLVGFDYSATKVILQDLARFHAVPIALKILKPKIFKEKILPSTVFNKNMEHVLGDICLAFQNAIIDGAKASPELEPYLDRIQKVIDRAMAASCLARTFPERPFITMCHADFWVSNTMIRKDNKGATIENKIVDLQLLRYWSCVCDLVFFLFTSVINSVLDEHFEEFLKIYHQSMLDTLSDFKIDLEPFSWKNFMEELEEVAPSETYHILKMLKPVCTERGKVTNNLEEFQDSDWSRKDLLGPNHRRKMKDTVLALVKRGWI